MGSRVASRTYQLCDLEEAAQLLLGAVSSPVT